MRSLLLLFGFPVLLFPIDVTAQYVLSEMMDTTTKKGKLLNIQFGDKDQLKFSGYIQPQFQWAEAKGISTYSGGDFSSNSNNRFMFRRARMKTEYAHYTTSGKLQSQLVFQIDGTERGIAMRDLWGRLYENKLELFSLTIGLFARPMGYEVMYSSSDRETPERGRMSQILMKTERDIGAMLTIDPRKSSYRWKNLLRFDIGVFNGQGLTSTTDFDSHKDVISRITIKPQQLNKQGWTIGVGISAYFGGIVNRGPWLYQTKELNGNLSVIGDSSNNNIASVAPRHYFGADVQFKMPRDKWHTELRAEYMQGKQTSRATTSETPSSYPMTSSNVLLPLYIRNFNGAYFYLLQHLGSNQVQLLVKYDWYDPNTKVSGNEINSTNGFSTADIRYSTVGTGFIYHISPFLKAVLYYDLVTNETTRINGFDKDLADDVLTVRLHYRF